MERFETLAISTSKRYFKRVGEEFPIRGTRFGEAGRSAAAGTAFVAWCVVRSAHPAKRRSEYLEQNIGFSRSGEYEAGEQARALRQWRWPYGKMSDADELAVQH